MFCCLWGRGEWGQKRRWAEMEEEEVRRRRCGGWALMRPSSPNHHCTTLFPANFAS